MNRRLIFTIFSGVFLISIASLFATFLGYHEAKTDESGILFNDPVFKILPLWDCSVYIFAITYGAIIYMTITAIKKNELISKFFLSYGIMLLIRFVTLTLVPLKAPLDIIHLQDPILDNAIYPGIVENDLFFSGHTAMLFMMYFLVKRKVVLVFGIILGFLLMIQRVHYSIDVLGAIPVAYIVVRIVNYISSKVLNEDSVK